MKRQLPKDGRYCAYLRKSRDDHDYDGRTMTKEETLRRHRAWLEEREASLGIHVSRWYEEVVSGDTIEARPVVQQVLAELEDQEWDGVLVMDVQRLARGNTKDQGIMCEALEFSEAFLITNDRIFDTQDESDMEYLEYGLYNARREFKTINRIQQNGRKRSVREGNYISSRPPYGYDKVRIGKYPSLAINEEQAKVVVMMFELAAAGTKADTIASMLNDLGISRPSCDSPWDAPSILCKIRNEVYMGKIVVNKWKTETSRDPETRKRVKRSVRQENYDIVDGKHPAIVSEELWHKANENGFKHRPVKNDYSLKFVYSGLVRCARCGTMMQRSLGAGTGNPRIQHQPHRGKGCVKSMRIDHFTDALVDRLKELVDDMEVSVSLGDDPLLNAAETELEAVRSGLERVERSRSKLLPRLMRELINDEEYAEAKAMLSEEQTNLEKRASELEAALASGRSSETMMLTVHQAIDMLKGEDATPEELNKFLKTFIKEIRYDNLGARTHNDVRLDIFFL